MTPQQLMDYVNSRWPNSIERQEVLEPLKLAILSWAEDVNRPDARDRAVYYANFQRRLAIRILLDAGFPPARMVPTLMLLLDRFDPHG